MKPFTYWGAVNFCLFCVFQAMGNGGTAGAAQNGYGDGYLTRHMTAAATVGGAGGKTGSGCNGQAVVIRTTVASGWGQAGVAGGGSGGSGTTVFSRDMHYSTLTAVLPRYSGFSGGGASGGQRDNQSGFDHADGGGGGGGGKDFLALIAGMLFLVCLICIAVMAIIDKESVLNRFRHRRN